MTIILFLPFGSIRYISKFACLFLCDNLQPPREKKKERIVKRPISPVSIGENFVKIIKQCLFIIISLVF